MVDNHHGYHPYPKVMYPGGGAVQNPPPGYIFTYYFPYWELYPKDPLWDTALCVDAMDINSEMIRTLTGLDWL